jgi:hypothetical protein
MQGEGHDGDDVAGADEVGGGSVYDDVAGFGFAWNDIGLEPGSAGDAGDEDFLANPKVHFRHQVNRDGDAALVIDIGIGDASAMDFGFELMSKHRITLDGMGDASSGEPRAGLNSRFAFTLQGPALRRVRVRVGAVMATIRFRLLFKVAVVVGISFEFLPRQGWSGFVAG